MNKLIGRKEERSILKSAIQSPRSELIVVYGRRRIGKTFLIRQTYKGLIKFEVSGINNARMKDQLKNFHLALKSVYPKANSPSDWIEAFHELKQYILKIRSKKKKVIFIDEFPWFDSRRSRFLEAFENFWNGFVSGRDDLVVAICGSAASYMINKIVKSKGGLHNRLTEKIYLMPFSLLETEKFLRSNNIILSRYDLVQLYMVLGGVPHYLEKIRKGESVAQIIDRLFFTKDGFLRNEFDNVFASLFDDHKNHEIIIRALAKARKGLTRNELLKRSRLESGGTLSKTIVELEESGFIEKYQPYLGKSGSLYRLVDEYSLFYLKYVENKKDTKGGVWMKLQSQQSFKIWSGFSFETICLKHIQQIKYALQIGGVNSSSGSWTERGSEGGAQIDLLIDRDDNVINICEVKYYKGPFTISKKYAGELRNKTSSFLQSTQTKKTIFVTFITSFGLVDNLHSRSIVQNSLSIDDLFGTL